MPLEELKGVLRLRKVSYRTLATALGIQLSTFSRKINRVDGSEFSRSEITALAEYLDLNPNQVIEYFFPDLVT